MARVRVEVVYALKDSQRIVPLSLEEGARAIDAVRASGLDAAEPVFPPGSLGIGIHGQRVRPDALLQDGDRVEIYRPLMLDPKEARRRRVSGKPARGRGRPG